MSIQAERRWKAVTKAYPWCFGDYMPDDLVCLFFRFRDACRYKTDWADYLERLMAKRWIRYTFTLERAYIEVKR